MAKLVLRLLLAALFLLAGAVHLLDPDLFLPVMPPAIPLPTACIIVSGICELAGGIGLLMPSARVLYWTGWSLLLLLVAIFPANIHMAQANIRIHGFPSRPWMGWARLPLQPLLMLGVSWATNIWPRTPAAMC